MENKVTLIYEGQSEVLGLVRVEVTPNGYGPATVRTYLNNQFVGKTGMSDAELSRQLKGLALIERR